MKKLSVCLGLLGLMILLGGCETCDRCCNEPRDTQPPAVPSGVASITGDGHVVVYWNPVIEEDLAGYGVYRSRYDLGPYRRIGDVGRDEATEFWDYDVTNGLTYFYAVDSYDFYGNESVLSYEMVDDTPRPEGWDLQIFTTAANADESAIAIKPDQGFDTIILLNYQDDWAQYYLASDGKGVLRFVPKGANQIQDFGYVDHPDFVDEAPMDGWSTSPAGVEVIAGHAYVLRTTTGYYGKIWVDTKGHNWVLVYWAFQSKPWLTELAPPRRGA
jgi:hypothetical protein